MKSSRAVAALIVLTTFSVFSDEALDKFKTLETLDGQVFTNAEITKIIAAYAVVGFDGGGKMVALTNLPAWLQKKYHFDAAATAAAEKKHAEQNAAALSKAKLQYDEAATWLGEPVEMKVLNASGGIYTVAINANEQVIVCPTMPRTVDAVFARLREADARIAGLKSQLEEQRRNAADLKTEAQQARDNADFWDHQTDTYISGDPGAFQVINGELHNFDTDLARYRNARNNANAAAQRVADAVEAAKTTESELETAQRERTRSAPKLPTILARPTGAHSDEFGHPIRNSRTTIRDSRTVVGA
jgi:hypothetical protein